MKRAAIEPAEWPKHLWYGGWWWPGTLSWPLKSKSLAIKHAHAEHSGLACSAVFLNSVNDQS